MSQVQNLHQTLVSTNEEEEEEEEEEALSLSDLPSKPSSPPSSKLNLMIPNPTDEFEFRVSFSANETELRTEMCAADDVFYNGTILPLRRLSASSRADSVDLSVSSGVTVLSTSRSGSSSSSSSSSSGSSSYCVSRSHSTKSTSGVLPIPDPPRRSVSNNFYAFPSPSPQLRSTGARKSNVMTSGRKSTSSVPGNILRLGVLPAPEIDIRSRRTTEKRSNTVEKKQQLGFGSYGAFGCKCVPDEVIEPTGTQTSELKLEASRKKVNGEDRGGRKVEKKSSPLKFNLRMGEKSLCRTRIFHWIEELSIGKTS